MTPKKKEGIKVADDGVSDEKVRDFMIHGLESSSSINNVDVGIHDAECLLILLCLESGFSFLNTEGLVCVEGHSDVLLSFSVVGGPLKLGDLIKHSRDTRCNHGESRDRNE